MTTGELIRRLQEADPTGELPVCVGNHDVYFIHKLPAHYDGPLQQLVHDEDMKPWYSIIGAKIITRGTKIDIVTMSIRECLLNYPDMPVECKGAHAERVEQWRKEAREAALEG